MLRPPMEHAPPANMDNVSADFIFGTMATDARRLAYVKAELSGLSHRQRIEPPVPLPGEPVRLQVSLGPRMVADRVTCYYTLDGSEPAGERGQAAPGSFAVEGVRRGQSWDTFLWGYLEEWEATLPPQPAGALVRYRLQAWQSLGDDAVWASELIGTTEGDGSVLGDVGPGDLFLREFGAAFNLTFIRRMRTFTYRVEAPAAAGWLADAVIYHVFVDRFAPGAGRSFAHPATPMGFYGGTLRGVIEQLDYMVELGVTALWLSPIFPSPSHHGYDATDYYSVEPRLGTRADLQELIAAAHKRGLRLLLDYTANHVSEWHPFFQAVLADPAGPYGSWFTFTRHPDRYVSFFGVASLPQVDNDYPAARRAMIEPALFWLRQGVDGFRLDYAIGPSHAFWSDFRAATRALNPQSVTIGEAVDTAEVLRSYGGRLDGCFDFLLLQQLRLFFAFHTISAAEFDAFLTRHLAFFPAGFCLPSFLDNHDMNRFLWVVGGDTRRLRLAALCQFSLPHPPVIYYGTEVGLSQERDVRHADGSGHPEESRLPMPWGARQDRQLLAFYRRLITLRRAYGPLWRGRRRTIHLDCDGGYAYLCMDGGQTVLVALNNSPRSRTIVLPAGNWQPLLWSETGAELQAGQVQLPPYGGAICEQA